MEDRSFGRVAKDRGVVDDQGFDFVLLEPNGGTLMMVGGVLVAQDALFDFATLAPVGSAQVTEALERKVYKRA